MEEAVHRVENVLGYSTVVSTIGFDTKGMAEKSGKVIVLIPGNPGLIEFYQVFVKRLYELKRLPIIGFSHAGHSPTIGYAKEGPRTPPLGLQEQIEHKVQCIKDFVPTEADMILIGHSIGAYTILKLMKHFPTRSAHGVLLFPTIEHMAKTVDGRFWTMVTSYFKFPFLYIAYFASYLPYVVQDLLVLWRAKWREIDPRLLSVCRRCVSYDVLNQGFRMVEDELDEVTEIGPDLSEIIQANSDRLTVYYGEGDAWTPSNFYESFMEKFPEVKTIIGKDGVRHDFVLDSSEVVADLCHGFLEDH